jgi:hypothetical protein
VEQDGMPLDLTTLRGKWLMVHVGPASCDAACAQQLYLMRQTRIAQGKEQSRIERLWVVTDAGTIAPALLQEYPGLRAWRPSESGFAEQFPATSSPGSHIYLVDPLGNLMLRFPAEPDAKRMMKDLKLLLKASQIGNRTMMFYQPHRQLPCIWRGESGRIRAFVGCRPGVSGLAGLLRQADAAPCSRCHRRRTGRAARWSGLARQGLEGNAASHFAGTLGLLVLGSPYWAGGAA